MNCLVSHQIFYRVLIATLRPQPFHKSGWFGVFTMGLVLVTALPQARGADTTLDLSGTWTICVTDDSSVGQNTVTNCNTCPPDTGCTTTTHEITYPPRCWSRGPMDVLQTGSALNYSATVAGGWCGPNSSDTCNDTLTGTVNGNSVAIVYRQQINHSAAGVTDLQYKGRTPFILC